MNVIRNTLFLAQTNNFFAFGIGVISGAGFELFKIHFSFRGVSYYQVFKKKQLEKELTKYELNLKDLDDTIAKSPEAAFLSNSAVGS